MRRLSVSTLAPLLAIASLYANSSPSQEAPGARLGGDLTPVGAERAGNADGSIPAWTGGLPKTAMDPTVGYTDPFADDAVLYTITAQNAEQYTKLLSAGHLTLLKRDARTFRMKVYPTRRSAAYPEDVLAEVTKQAPLVRQDGYRVLDTGHTSVPFPIPTEGLQVMWNHVFRWRGGSRERQYIWAPVTGGGQFYVVRLRAKVAWNQHGYMEESRQNRLYNATQVFMSPPSLTGVRNAEWEPINAVDDPRVRWLYAPQTVDTRRLPAFGYDMAEPATNGLRLADQSDGWNGAPDKFDWKLIGKRELLIGYNAYRLADRTLRYADIIKPRNLDPELLRYEKHRVWVVEATQRKPHAFYRRIFYVDEDTWQVAQEEDFNKKGQLGRFGDHHMIQYYDATVPWYAATIHHDLKSGAYIVTYLNNMEPFPTRWGFKGRIAEYLPSYLRVLALP